MAETRAAQNKARTRALQDSKRAVQGVIARFKSVRQGQVRRDSKKRKPPVVEIDPQEEMARNAKAVVLTARGRLSPEQYDEFLDYVFAVLPKISSAERHFYNVQGFSDAPAIPLENELRWLVAWLGRQTEEIERHLAHQAIIDRLVLSGRFGDALREVDRHIDREGHTLWAVQLALALEQRTGGLEAQKRRHEQLRRRNRKGLLAYVSYMTSVRNEDRTTLSGFKNDLETRNSRVRPRSLARYSLYRLAGIWPADKSAIADVLRTEQSNGPIDAFETLIQLAQTCIRDPEKRWLLPLVCDHIRSLKVSDFRIDKVLLHAGEEPRQPLTRYRSATIGDALLEGRLTLALSHRSSTDNLADPWAVIYRALAAAHSGYLRRALRPTPTRSLAIVAGQANDSNSYSAEFLKQSFNLANVPSQQALLDFANQLRTEGHEEPFRFSLPSLNCVHIGPEDLTDLAGNPGTVANVASRFSKTSSLAFWRQDDQTGARLRPEVGDFSKAVALERNEDWDGATSIISPHVENNASNLLRRLSAALLLRSLTLTQDRTRIIELIAEEAARPDASLDRLPVAPAMQLVDFGHVKSLGRSLAGIVFLDVQQKMADGDDAAASKLRFATKTFLRGTPNKKPSLMVEDGNDYPASLLVYFLRFVCIPSVIDVSLIFNTSAEVLEERQAICAALNSIDPVNRQAYEAELLGLVHNARIAAGLQIINKNRVHVDVDAIVRAFTRTGNELFQRYQDLLRAGIGVSDSYDEVLREITSATRHARPLLFNPDNEADAALIQLVVRAREEFLHSTMGGLDFFLSKRIRHQSFVGLVRGPLEFENLITTKETAASQYRENEYWLSRLGHISDTDRATISGAFTTFAIAFDEAILNVKDKAFHVRSAEHPDGIFDIPLTATTMLLIRSVANSITSSEEFIRAMIAIFWALIDPNLSVARRSIREDLKMKVAALIDGLRTTVGTALGESSSAIDFSLAVGRSSSQVQLALSEAEAWFNRPDVAQAAQLFTLEEAVDIAIESAKKLNRAFSPPIERVVKGDISLSAGDLVFITDAVFIAFSNVRAYSHLKTPRVTLECVVNEQQGTLVLDVTNDVGPRARSAEQDVKLQGIRDQIQQGLVGKQVKREGGTGFLKLASVVSQSPKGQLEFGYVSDTEFRLHVAWSLIVKEADELDDAHPDG
ncbi:hypothetical protein GHV40_16005 [Devosia sp. D6-9]|nr:hypothetical protein GHV40_16005 [Devosia sp. D6-9]